jgi:hypothetical protein
VRRHKKAVIDLMIRDHPIRSRLNPPNTHHLTDGNSRVGYLPLVARQHLIQAPPDSHEDETIITAHLHPASPETTSEASSSERY